LNRTQSFPFVRDLFLHLKGVGQKIVLASSGRKAEVEHHCRVARVDDLIDGYTSADDAEHSKPCPDIFAAALKLFPKHAGGDTVVVGDTPYDAQAASALGLPVVGLLCGGFSRAELEVAGCVEVYRDPEHLLRDYARSAIRPMAP
jgi:beta-phosphoglucomutase-like phosphatase (HAD superfamily)